MSWKILGHFYKGNYKLLLVISHSIPGQCQVIAVDWTIVLTDKIIWNFKEYDNLTSETCRQRTYHVSAQLDIVYVDMFAVHRGFKVLNHCFPSLRRRNASRIHEATILLLETK